MFTQPNKKLAYPPDFNAITLKMASPDRIREWSHGEVTRSETINYRTGRSERGGLFDERIFGPEKDYECYCGKYRRIRYKDIVCERCGVEVTHSLVRRERMGHIELANPVAHIWYVRSVPSRLGLFFNLSVSDLEKVIYFAGCIVVKVNESERSKTIKNIDGEYKQRLKQINDEASRQQLQEAMLSAKRSLENLAVGRVLDEATYYRLALKYGSVFEADIGAEALYRLCRASDLDKMIAELENVAEKTSALERQKIQKRYNLIKSMKRAGLRPEWMFLVALPVIPPDLRPMVMLDGGRHATSDVNDLYRRVINRNNRLKKLKELNAPDVILRNEKRILQEAVDALMDNSIRRSGQSAVSKAQRRPLKSLADNLRGKQGRFRQHLLGKRVDYSGRSVIVVGPELKLHQCGLPKLIALEIFRPFVIAKILERELAYNIRGAGRMISDRAPEVWAILEEVTQNKFVLLNRPPTLHRLGIQGFQPVLIEGSAIQIHPLVCAAYNADFDGDQMGVYLPLSSIAQREVKEFMAADKNILKPGSGNPVVNLRQDIVLGCFWVTKISAGVAGEGKTFSTPGEAILAFQFGEINIRALIQLPAPAEEKYAAFADQTFETSVGRILFNETLPSDLPFFNGEVDSREINILLEKLITRYGIERLAPILDRIKTFGFFYASYSGITWGIDEVPHPPAKEEIIAEAKQQAVRVEKEHNEGLLSDEERYRLVIKIWAETKNKVERDLINALDPDGSVITLLASGARGSNSQISQMGGMKGLIINPSGRLIDFPIISSHKEGLTPLEYFITTHGSRKSLTDTALNTAKAGYLTRRLVYVADEVVVREKDCGDRTGWLVSTANVSGFDRGVARLIRGRVLARDLLTPAGKVFLTKGHLVLSHEAVEAERSGISEAQIRSIFTCRSIDGVCQLCYGTDLGRGQMVSINEPVGIVAAQAIGEPGTQLTMRTKHTGGVDVGGDIVGGLPRVEEIFERRRPKNAAVISPVDGEVIEVRSGGRDNLIVIHPMAAVKQKKKGETIKFEVSPVRDILVKQGETVSRGQALTDGPIDLQELFKERGREAIENYILNEINKIYELQGAMIAPKHIEVIIRQMFSRWRIKDSGDTNLEAGETIENVTLLETNEEVVKRGGKKATAEPVLLGVSEVSLTTSSFIAGVSFGQATRVLIKAAVRGAVDKLRRMKENVVIGRLIPAGTGLKSDYKETLPSAEDII